MRRSIPPARGLAVSAAGLALTSLLALPTSAQEIPGPGFAQTAGVPLPTFGSTYGTLSDESFLQFDGLSFELYAADGSFLANLGSLPGFVFPSFVVIDPTKSFAVAGESSNGDLFVVDLGGGGVSTLANLNFNFDAAFDVDAGELFVSAAASGAGNDLYQVDLGDGSLTQIAHVDGPSGPVAVDADGNLFYATLGSGFPPPPGSTDVLVWSKAQVDSGMLLDENDAAVFSAGFDGGTSLAFAPGSGNLLLAENDFATGEARVHEIDGNGARRWVVLDSTRTLSNLELFSDGGSATFQAFQPTAALLKLNATDFGASTSDVLTIEPRRPVAALSGPTSGPGVKTLTVEDALPDAGVLVLVGPQSAYDADGFSYRRGFDFPFHTNVPLPLVRRFPLITPTDSSGTATFQYYDPGSLHGTLVLQGVVMDGTGAPVGTSTAALN